MRSTARATWGSAWSPDGKELAFQAQRADGAPTAIYIVRVDGRGRRRLAAGHDPVWSPDGRRLAFIYDYRLITIDRNGKNRLRVSRKGEFVGSAAWSPKGGTIAYVASTAAGHCGSPPGTPRLETVSADGKRTRVLARGARALIRGSPVWTQDGKRILVAVG